ncbi:MAG: hypothetical protein ACTSR8_08965 [Promethearchaeota archaeon]
MRERINWTGCALCVGFALIIIWIPLMIIPVLLEIIAIELGISSSFLQVILIILLIAVVTLIIIIILIRRRKK